MPLRRIANAGASDGLQGSRTGVPAVRDRDRCGFARRCAWLLLPPGRSVSMGESIRVGTRGVKGIVQIIQALAITCANTVPVLVSGRAIMCISGTISWSGLKPDPWPDPVAAEALSLGESVASLGSQEDVCSCWSAHPVTPPSARGRRIASGAGRGAWPCSPPSISRRRARRSTASGVPRWRGRSAGSTGSSACSGAGDSPRSTRSATRTSSGGWR